ncbi:hypothetical protein Cylst_2741 [Cylindrospermum stagnale PCC 7417]|uniref:Uncharacterized protein n=1 Tax=Cylindrospermum stagnale PCC 7417 TaxID=56107 RepID=K9WXJ7_9NOST|nr:hypothetical protein Cylst_2741 [Cylindrospermum stagnale PCC 7417]
MFVKSNLLLALATRSRAPLASPKGRRCANKSAEPTTVASSRETLSAVPPGGDPQDRTASPRRCLPNAVAWLDRQNPPARVKNVDFSLRSVDNASVVAYPAGAGGSIIFAQDF